MRLKFALGGLPAKYVQIKGICKFKTQTEQAKIQKPEMKL